jgi:hypothetical protein
MPRFRLGISGIRGVWVYYKQSKSVRASRVENLVRICYYYLCFTSGIGGDITETDIEVIEGCSLLKL